jgi:hypothetical protein
MIINKQLISNPFSIKYPAIWKRLTFDVRFDSILSFTTIYIKETLKL